MTDIRPIKPIEKPLPSQELLFYEDKSAIDAPLVLTLEVDESMS